MLTLDELFYKEFKETMNLRASHSELSIRSLPVPNQIVTSIPNKPNVLVKDLEDDYFFKLVNNRENTSLPKLLTNQKLYKRMYRPDNSPILEEDGTVKKEYKPVPRNMSAVLSNICVKVPKKYESPTGCEYVDYVEKNGKRAYIYFLPKRFLYKVNMCALVINMNKLRNFYTGIRVTLTTGHSIYLQVIPYTPKQDLTNLQYRILSVKPKCNFDSELELLLKYWEMNGIIFNRSYTKLSEPIKGMQNVGIYQFPPTLDFYEMYDREKSLEGYDDNYF